MQIDPDKQQAAVRSTEASRAGAEADVRYWRAAGRSGSRRCVAAGAISRQEFEQAQNSLRTAEARLAAVDAQVSEERVELALLPRRRPAGRDRRRHRRSAPAIASPSRR